MKFLKTGKGKVIVSAAVVFFFTVGGVAFASSGAGENLKDWYDKVFADETDAAMDETEEYGEDAADDFEDDYANRKDNKADQIDRKRGTETDKAIETIDASKDEHIKDLGESKEEILDDMGIKFYDFYMEAWQEIQDKAGEAEGLLDDDMEQFANDEGEVAIDDLSDDLGDAKEEAVSELEGSIEDAKEDIGDELDDRGDNLVYNLESQVDHEIEMLRSHVSDILYDLTEEQKELIAEAAGDKEAEAKDAMDDVVENMSN